MSYAVFVNSTDSFEDCWGPFFDLFARFWPDCDVPIWLNTETKSFNHPDLALQCAQVGEEFAGGKSCWSASLLHALDKVEQEYVLYLQDDYFLNGRVRHNALRRLAGIMEDERIPHLRLGSSTVSRHLIGAGSVHPKYPELRAISGKARYLFCLQSGLWEKNALLNCLRPGEDAWTAERNGNRRARRLGRDFYFLTSESDFGREPVFPYTPTGIVGGKWFAPAVEELFRQEGIEIDFSIRGFFDETRLNTRRAKLRQLVRRLLTRF